MLVQDPRRQQASSFEPFDFSYQQHGLPSPPATACIPPLISPHLEYHLPPYSNTQSTCADDCHPHNYALSSPEYYMPTTPSYNPPIRVHHSTPSAGAQQSHHSSIGDGSGQQHASWGNFDTLAHLSPQVGAPQQQFFGLQDHRSHKRHSSGSSIGSAGPASPYTPTGAFPRIVDSDLSSYPSPGFDTFDGSTPASSSYHKALPTVPPPTFTETFVAPDFHIYYRIPENAQAHLTAMRQAFMAQQESEIGEPSSVPRSSYNGECDDGYKVPEPRSNMPKLDRTMSDVYQDELYTSIIPTSAPTQQPASQKNLLTPSRDALSQRLQAANENHLLSAQSNTPSTVTSRGHSPFRPDSQFAAEVVSQRGSPRGTRHFGSTAQGQPHSESDAVAYAQQQSADVLAPKTISPKDAFAPLEYNEATEESSTPLFPPDSSATPAISQSIPYPGLKSLAHQDSAQSDAYETGTQQSFNSMATTRRESSSNYSSASGFAPSRPKLPNASPSNAQIPQQYPFISQSRRQNSSNQSPEFHATLTSMESTKSESGLKSSQEQSEGSAEVQRPARTTADTGTYSCTYHGCTQRFESAQKLQRHKRDAHRLPSPHNAGNSPGSSSAAALAARNGQAGPHKCERINPTTGKPCNSIFSRPYDLTRHEDTIHNSRKQKVRCQLCTEEKTFSRNDALTRHMRVVHPEVDFPGKTKRKGGN